MPSPATPQQPAGPRPHPSPASYPAPPLGPVVRPRQPRRPPGASAIIPPRALDIFTKARLSGWFTKETIEPQEDGSTLYTLQVGRKIHPDERDASYVGDTHLYTMVWSVPARGDGRGRGASRANLLRDRSTWRTPIHRNVVAIPSLNDVILFIHRNPRPRGSKHAAELRVDRLGRSTTVTPEDRRRNGISPDTRQDDQ